MKIMFILMLLLSPVVRAEDLSSVTLNCQVVGKGQLGVIKLSNTFKEVGAIEEDLSNCLREIRTSPYDDPRCEEYAKKKIIIRKRPMSLTIKNLRGGDMLLSGELMSKRDYDKAQPSSEEVLLVKVRTLDQETDLKQDVSVSVSTNVELTKGNLILSEYIKNKKTYSRQVLRAVCLK